MHTNTRIACMHMHTQLHIIPSVSARRAQLSLLLLLTHMHTQPLSRANTYKCTSFPCAHAPTHTVTLCICAARAARASSSRFCCCSHIRMHMHTSPTHMRMHKMQTRTNAKDFFYLLYLCRTGSSCFLIALLLLFSLTLPVGFERLLICLYRKRDN